MRSSHGLLTKNTRTKSRTQKCMTYQLQPVKLVTTIGLRSVTFLGSKFCAKDPIIFKHKLKKSYDFRHPDSSVSNAKLFNNLDCSGKKIKKSRKKSQPPFYSVDYKNWRDCTHFVTFSPELLTCTQEAVTCTQEAVTCTQEAVTYVGGTNDGWHHSCLLENHLRYCK